MKKITVFIISFVLFNSVSLFAQLDANADTNKDSLVVNVDVLKALQSPAANLLGISNSDISRPSDPAAIMTSFQQATSNFTEVPLNYAIDISPAWLFGYKNIKADNYLSNKIKYNIPQSLVISTAVNNNDVLLDSAMSVKNTALGLGVKFSFLRGHISNDQKTKLDEIRNALVDNSRNFSAEIESRKANSVKYQNASKIVFNDSSSDVQRTEALDSLNAEQARIIDEVSLLEASKARLLKLSEQDIDLSRYGFKLDFNAAISIDFQNRIYGNSKIGKAAAWLTLANEWESGFSVLGIARYIKNPGGLFSDEFGIVTVEDLSILNVGIKLLFEKDNFTFSFEGLTQSVSGESNIESGTKYLLNTEYTLSQNMKLSMTFGKDFNNMITKEGSVISALNFLMGFGNKRKV